MKSTKLLSHTTVIDLFSGIGGLSHGFVLEGFQVAAGIDIDKNCKYGFEKNNNAKFIHKDIAAVNSKELIEIYGNSKIRVLVGCAPCQPFSTLNVSRVMYKNDDILWGSLDKFRKLIREIKPEIVSMENVRELADTKKYPVFLRFINTLKKEDYYISYKIIDASKYGVPQKRKRLVLLASRLGPISLIEETHSANNVVTVRDSIGDLPAIQDGQTHRLDPMHKTSKLSDMNKKRILATPKNGGCAKDWRRSLLPDCYKTDATYKSSVYGRMRWNEPAPTMTTHCTSLGTGRFGHPTQNRAISLREAARFQTFPDYYEFDEPGKILSTRISKFIGNAVPVKLGRVIAQSIKRHLREVQE